MKMLNGTWLMVWLNVSAKLVTMETEQIVQVRLIIRPDVLKISY